MQRLPIKLQKKRARQDFFYSPEPQHVLEDHDNTRTMLEICAGDCQGNRILGITINELKRYFFRYQAQLNKMSQNKLHTPYQYRTPLGKNFLRLYDRMLNRPITTAYSYIDLLFDIFKTHPDCTYFIKQTVIDISLSILNTNNSKLIPTFVIAIQHPHFDPNEILCAENTFHPDDPRKSDIKTMTLFQCLYRECQQDNAGKLIAAKFINPLLNPESLNRFQVIASKLINPLFNLERLNRFQEIAYAMKLSALENSPYIPLNEMVDITLQYPDFLLLRFEPSLYLSLLCRDVFLKIATYTYPKLKLVQLEAPYEIMSANTVSEIASTADNITNENPAPRLNSK